MDDAYLDFGKAFDSMPHERLIYKLRDNGIGGKLLDWIHAFLVGLHQRVVIQGSMSKWTPVTSGIPQGSVFSPILFTIFVNDIPAQVSHHVKLFADNTKMYCRVTNKSVSLQTNIDALVTWPAQWPIPFNASKSKVMHIGSNNAEQPYSLGWCAISSN